MCQRKGTKNKIIMKSARNTKYIISINTKWLSNWYKLPIHSFEITSYIAYKPVAVPTRLVGEESYN